MSYDRKKVKKWIAMKDWGDYIVENGGLDSKEGYDFLTKRYFRKVRRRINYCKRLLKEHEDAFLNYVLAKLYDNYDVEKSDTYLHKWPVKYYCHRALEIDPDFALARELLQDVYNWLDFLNGAPGDTMQDFNNDFWR